MKKKLWEIPRLKIGATAKKEDDGIDSPPPTPKSLVPALSPKVDYELRTACALVLQDFKPSDYVYHERFGDADDDDPHLDRKTHLDYAAFMQALEDGSDEAAAPLDPVNTRVLLDEPRTYGADVYTAISGLPRATSDKTTSRTYSDGLWKRVRGEQAEEEEKARPKPPTRPPPSQPHASERTVSHKRSASQPIKLTGTPLRDDFPNRPKMERANSTRTPGSTPGSEGTDRGLLGSTAPTTAAITPAADSKRIFSHMRTKSADTKICTVDGDWMRRELETHRQAQEEDNAHQRMAEQFQGVNGDTEAFIPSTSNIGDAISPVAQDAQVMSVTKAPAPAVRVPVRKPVPRASVDIPRIGDTLQRGDSMASVDVRRSTSQKTRSTPRSESRAELEFLESSRQSREQSRAPPSEPETPVFIPRTTRPYNGVRAPAPSANVSQAPSRSRSITRQIREFVRRPSISSLKQSAEVSSPASRSRSMESTRSAVSAVSNDASSSRWKSWRPFQRAQSSTTSVEDGGQETRGRDSASDAKDGKAKPPINLNRELPPLPSLDQWKEDAPEPEPPVPSLPNHIANPGIDTFANAQDNALRSQNHSIDSTNSHRPRDSVLNETSPPARVHPKRMSSLVAPTNPLKWQNPEQPTVDPSTIPSTPDTVPELKSSHRLSPSATDDPKPAKLPTRTTSLRYNPTSKPQNATPRHVSTASVPTAALNRTGSTHRGDPQLNFSRKISTDYQRGEYKHFVDVDAPAVPPKDGRKKRWWRPQKKASGWMEQIVKGGSKNGVVVAEGGGEGRRIAR